MIPLDLTADREGERLDAFLARSVPDLTRSAAQRLLERGAVTLRGRAAKKNDKTRLGDSLTVCLPEPQPVDLVPQNIPLDVIYEDDDVIVVNKPVGLVVHPAPRTPRRDPGQRPAVPLWDLSLPEQRGASPRHRPPH